MPQPDDAGNITVTEAEWRATMDHITTLVRERNSARRELGKARKYGRKLARLAIDACEVIEGEGIADPEENEDFRVAVGVFTEALKPKRARRR